MGDSSDSSSDLARIEVEGIQGGEKVQYSLSFHSALNSSVLAHSTPSSITSSPPLTRNRKRKSLLKDSPGAPKKVRMGEKDMEYLATLIKESHKETKDTVGKMIEEANNPLKDSLEQLQQATAAIAQNSERNADDIKELKAGMVGLKEEIKEEIKREIRGELDSAQNEAYKNGVARDIERVAMNIVIHGLNCQNMAGVRGLIDELMGVEKEKIEIRKVTPLGKGQNVKSILVELGDPSQRNILLGNMDLKKLPQGVKIERDCPPAFRAKFKEYKQEDFRYKAFFQVKTQIVFMGAELVLRYKDEGEKAFTIIDSFTPSLSKSTMATKSGNRTEGGRAPSNSITAERKKIAMNCFLFTDLKDSSTDEIQEMLKGILEQDFSHIQKIKILGGRPTIQCDSVEGMRKVTQKIEERNGPKTLAFVD